MTRHLLCQPRTFRDSPVFRVAKVGIDDLQAAHRSLYRQQHFGKSGFAHRLIPQATHGRVDDVIPRDDIVELAHGFDAVFDERLVMSAEFRITLGHVEEHIEM